MKVTALAAHTPEAVRAVLAARGWESQPAWVAAPGLDPLVVLRGDITEADGDARVQWGTRPGGGVRPGDGWALAAGGARRLAPLARSDRAPAGRARPAPPLFGSVAARAARA